ncbi:uncharacterized protein NMK_1239 [Novimethylophilus kurashikiensis]|uniref:Uncharacterized protein n=2 Tax=Novimethylophilus kurashikiensis TaxID=1825523 RepID=A0A2R5F807_9PROT|nr:uncharacterized protein NMK_1239 [Novimethylophilus kurashikiensis]
MLFRSLKYRVAVFLCIVLACIATLTVTLRWASQAHLNRDMANQAYLNAKQQLRAQVAEEAEMARDLPRYRQLQQRGLIGEENRKAWIDHLSYIAARHHWQPIEYEFDQPQIVKDASSGLQLSSSVMRLHLLLMHEEALLQLFAALPSQQLAPVIPRKCTIVTTQELHHELDAHCEFQWITFSESKAAI